MEMRWSSCLSSLTSSTSRYGWIPAGCAKGRKVENQISRRKIPVCLGHLQVTELKGLASHMLVGSVICETKELFTAMPQVVAVDVNDLGTIKLNLEVTWQ